MYPKLLVLLAVVLWSATTLPLPKEARAETALNRAVVQNIRNLVRLIPRNRTARPARVSDAMKPGDALSTGRSSLAELRFNDGSLARIGEQAVFRFIAKTRNFRLSNGTVLLLIPPGRGITGVQTPNAAAAIRGSALFVRYIPGTNTTIVGSLTDSNIEVSNEGGSQSEVLEAGQMAVIVEDRIEQLYEFDLNTFYETSDLVQELNLDQPSTEASPDPAIASVQAETSEAAATQAPITGEGVIENPTFVQPSAASEPTPTDNSNTGATTTTTDDSTTDTVTTPANNTTSTTPVELVPELTPQTTSESDPDPIPKLEPEIPVVPEPDNSVDTGGDPGSSTGDTGGDAGGSDTGDTGNDPGSNTGDTGGSDTGDTGGSDTGDTGGSDTGDTGGSDTGDTGGSDTGDTGGDAGGSDTGDTGNNPGSNTGDTGGDPGGSDTGDTGGDAGGSDTGDTGGDAGGSDTGDSSDSPTEVPVDVPPS